MTNNRLTLFCLVDGESTSNALPVEIESTETISDLKDLIKAKKTPKFDDIAACNLILWHVSIPATDDGQDEQPVLLDSLAEKKKLFSPRGLISQVFPQPPDNSTYISVQRPPPVSKRSREEDVASPPKKTRLSTITLMDAIEGAGLTQKIVVDNKSDLSLLDYKERVSVLGFLGCPVDKTDIYDSLSTTALALRRAGTDIQLLESISAPGDTWLPIVDTQDLYVREDYKNLYKDITSTFTDRSVQNRIVVTGTSGIGKSAFLVYFAVRLLSESDGDNPPIIVFHTKQGSTCYVYGGISTVRTGEINKFQALLGLPETWYIVDSSQDPVLGHAKSILSASPEALVEKYKEVTKESPRYYNMAPWDLNELERCRVNIKSFNTLKPEFVEMLYVKVGGIPRYVLQSPSIVLGRNPKDIIEAEKEAYRRVKEAINCVKEAIIRVDKPNMLLECFAQGRDPLKFSSHILHRWPKDDHRDYYLAWASPHIQEEIGKQLREESWALLLRTLVHGGQEVAGGPLFELYVHHIFRKGGFSFEIKDLEAGTTCGHLDIPADSPVKSIHSLNELSGLSAKLQKGSKMPLFIPTIPNFQCIDLALAPDKLFQATVSLNHPIKQAPLKEIVENIFGDEWKKGGKNGNHLGLYFVVPNRIYADFKAQDYCTSAGVASQNVPAIVQQRVRQYALKIDLE